MTTHIKTIIKWRIEYANGSLWVTNPAGTASTLVIYPKGHDATWATDFLKLPDVVRDYIDRNIQMLRGFRDTLTWQRIYKTENFKLQKAV